MKEVCVKLSFQIKDKSLQIFKSDSYFSRSSRWIHKVLLLFIFTGQSRKKNERRLYFRLDSSNEKNIFLVKHKQSFLLCVLNWDYGKFYFVL